MLQVLYNERPGPLNGWASGRDYLPDINLEFPTDPIVGVFGTYANEGYPGYNRAITSIGFNMASGQQNGPYGTPYGNPFTFTGKAYGFFGSGWNDARYITSIGVYTDPPTPPPAPPARPPPPPPPANGTSPPPAYNLGRIKSFLSGSAADGTYWDDGPSSGASLHCIQTFAHVSWRRTRRTNPLVLDAPNRVPILRPL